MSKYYVEGTDLESVADAIRERGGTDSPLVFPAGFVSAIEDIPSGGDYTVTNAYALFASRPEMVDYVLPNVNNLIWAPQMFNNCFNAALYPQERALLDLSGIKYVGYSNGTAGSLASAFQNCGQLIRVKFFDFSEYIPHDINCSNMFYGCDKMKVIDMTDFPLPGTNASNASVGFPTYSGVLECVKIPTAMTTIPSGMTVSGAGHLVAFVVPGTTLKALQQNIFSGTPIASGTGYIYVPDDLVNSYKAATNWSTYANQIKPISELPDEYK